MEHLPEELDGGMVGPVLPFVFSTLKGEGKIYTIQNYSVICQFDTFWQLRSVSFNNDQNKHDFRFEVNKSTSLSELQKITRMFFSLYTGKSGFILSTYTVHTSFWSCSVMLINTKEKKLSFEDYITKSKNELVTHFHELLFETRPFGAPSSHSWCCQWPWIAVHLAGRAEELFHHTPCGSLHRSTQTAGPLMCWKHSLHMHWQIPA